MSGYVVETAYFVIQLNSSSVCLPRLHLHLSSAVLSPMGVWLFGRASSALCMQYNCLVAGPD